MGDPEPRSARWRSRTAWSAALAGVALVATAVWVFDWNWFKGPLERRGAAWTGRPVQVAGDIEVDLGRTVRAEIAGISVGNAPWAANRELATIERLRIHFDAMSLLRGRPRFALIELDRPILNLERNARGEPNWRMPRREAASRRPLIDALVIRNGSLSLRERKLGTDLRLDVDTAPLRPDEASPALLARGTGSYRAGDFALAGRADSPLRLLERGLGYRVDVRARAGATTARVHGALGSPLDPRNFGLRAQIEGQDLAELYRLLGFAMPSSPPYSLEGRLERDGDTLRYRNFSGRLGDSVVSGELSVDLGGDRPFARGDIQSSHLDFDDLAVLVGAPPDTGPGETANPEQRAEAAERAARPRVLPDRPYDVTKLKSIDADVRVRATNVESKKLPIDSLRAHVRLTDGVMNIEPLHLGVAGGSIAGSVTLDARRRPISTSTDLRASNLALKRLIPRLEDTSVGLIGGVARLEGRGNSVATMLATADGNLETVMGRGSFSNLALELAGLDVAESLKFVLGKDKAVELRCAYATFAVDDGVMQARSMAFDTSDTVVFGRGNVDLRREQIDLTLRARPKDRSPVSLRVPLEVAGSFKRPSVRPQAGPLVARAAAAAALYAVAPPAALLALIETGPGEDANCEFAGVRGLAPDADDADARDRD
jgi:uncharacterized protein involved in outer membrane biogenesis